MDFIIDEVEQIERRLHQRLLKVLGRGTIAEEVLCETNTARIGD